MSALFEMGGYALYVWGSVGAAVAVFAWNLVAPALRRRELLDRLADPEAMEDDEA
ncbi:MAG: heme exporter protein CcmD [Panacagrimonas sp.]